MKRALQLLTFGSMVLRPARLRPGRRRNLQNRSGAFVGRVHYPLFVTNVHGTFTSSRDHRGGPRPPREQHRRSQDRGGQYRHPNSAYVTTICAVTGFSPRDYSVDHLQEQILGENRSGYLRRHRRSQDPGCHQRGDPEDQVPRVRPGEGRRDGFRLGGFDDVPTATILASRSFRRYSVPTSS